MKSASPTPRKNFSLSSRQRKQLSHTKQMCKTGPWCWEPGGKRTSEGLDHLLSLNTPPLMGFPGGPVVKNLPANAGDARDMGLIPGLGRPSGVGNSKPLYSCLENPMDKGAWWDTVHWVTEGQIQLSMSWWDSTPPLDYSRMLGCPGLLLHTFSTLCFTLCQTLYLHHHLWPNYLSKEVTLSHVKQNELRLSKIQ